MVKIVYTYSLLNTGEPTFISTNGLSIFDLCLIYGPFVCRYKHNTTTDEYVELFTGAPNRGHLPVLVEFAVFTKKTQNKEVVDGESKLEALDRLCFDWYFSTSTTPLHSGKLF